MTDPLHQLLNPKDERPPRRPVWPWLAASVLLVGIAIWAFWRPGGSDEGSAASDIPEASTSVTGPAGPGATVNDPGAVSEAPVVLLEDSDVIQAGWGPQPEFDTRAYGEEQVLMPVDGIGLEDRAWLQGQDVTLEVTERQAIGTVRAPMQMFATAGTIADPYQTAYGAPGYCHLLSTGSDRVSSCFAYDPPGTPTPLFAGSVGLDFLAWGLLDEEVSVAVLSVNDVAVAWQRPRGSTVVFSHTPQIGDQIELILLTALGEEMGRSDRIRPEEPTGSYTEPITGYGDFSSVAFDDIDTHEVNSLIVECVIDQGFAVTLLPPNEITGLETIGLFDVPERDWAAADLAHARCRSGLNLPPKPPRSLDEIQTEYDSLIEMQLCLANLGFSVDPAPPFEQWTTDPPETRWDPILIILMSNPEEAEQALQQCLGGQ
jgi:hypothetical protein